MAYEIDNSCTACGTCLTECPVEAITVLDDGIYEIDPDVCDDCGICGDVCLYDAIHFA